MPDCLIAWLQGELALIHIIWQSLAALDLIYADALSRPSGQWGLLLLLLSFAGLLYSLRLSLGARHSLSAALVAALGPNFRQKIPETRRQMLRQGVNWREWMRPFAMQRPGVECVRNISYGQAGDRNLLDIYKPSRFLQNYRARALKSTPLFTWVYWVNVIFRRLLTFQRFSPA